jgi:hypothetical protein
MIDANEQRLAQYRFAAQNWAAAWRGVERKIRDKPLSETHQIVLERALVVF